MAFRVFLDPGHGGTDPGAVYNGRQEKDDVLRLAMAVGRILEDNGIDVVYSRTDDFYDSPYEKAMKGNESEADLFLSIHRNAAEQPGSGTGVDMLVYADTGFSSDVANQIGNAIEDMGFQYNGITERPNLAVLRRTKMPAVLVEAGFIDNEYDNQFFDQNFDALAEAIAQGILNTWEQDTGFDTVSVNNFYTDHPENMVMNSDFSSAFTDKDPAQIINQQIETEESACPSSCAAPGGPGQPGRPQAPGGFGNTGNPQAPGGFGNTGNPPAPGTPDPRLYRVQVGAFTNPMFATQLLNQLLLEGFPAFVVFADGLYRVQVGAYEILDNAIRMEKRLRNQGYQTYITT